MTIRVLPLSLAVAVLCGCGAQRAGNAAPSPAPSPPPSVATPAAAPSPPRIPAGACEGLDQVKCRAAYTLAGLNWRKCHPATGTGCLDGPVTPPPSTAAAPAATPALLPQCTVGWVNIPAGSGTAVQDKQFLTAPPKPDTADGYSLSDYEAIQVSLTASGQDYTVNDVEIVFYNSAGAEISSGDGSIGDVITPGQTLTFVYDESMGSDLNPPAGAATCSVISYD